MLSLPFRRPGSSIQIRKYLILAHSDPRVWDGAWNEAWPGPRVLFLFPPGMVGHPRTDGRPQALRQRPPSLYCLSPQSRATLGLG